MGAETAVRKPRSDGLRNRAMIVDVARDHFREHGTSASLEAIGRFAGVGPGTLYRHFPTRDDLVAAVLALRDREVIERLDAIERLSDASSALDAWVDAIEVYLGTLNDLVGPIGRALSNEDSAIAVSCQWLIEASDRIVDRVQSSGEMAGDLRGKDVLYAAFAIAWARRTAGEDVQSAEAVRRVMMRGLRSI
jgi:AcrR family transcriptional regulator